jgi:hypothetical protein
MEEDMICNKANLTHMNPKNEDIFSLSFQSIMSNGASKHTKLIFNLSHVLTRYRLFWLNAVL